MFIFKRNSYYHLEYFDDEENRIKRISTKCKKKTEALDFLAVFRDSIKDRKIPDYISLINFEKKYVDYAKQTKSQSYVRNIEFSLKILREEFGDDTPLMKLTQNKLESFFLNRYQSVKYSTAMIYRTLKSALEKAIQWNYISTNPFKKIKLPQIPKNKPAFIDEVQLRQIVSYETDNTLKQIYLFAFYSGCRIGEILNLKWNSVDFKERLVTIKNQNDFTTKNKESRVIPLNNILVEILKDRIPEILNINNDNLIFTNAKGIRFRTDTVSKWFKECVKDAVKEHNIDKNIHLHSLRHSFASCLIQRGVSIYEVSKLLGHSDIKVTEIYSHLKPENLRNAVDLLN